MNENGTQRRALGRGLQDLMGEMREPTLAEQTATATVDIIRAIDGLPARMAAVAFDNARRVLEAAKIEAGESTEEISYRLDELATERAKREAKPKRGWFGRRAK